MHWVFVDIKELLLIFLAVITETGMEVIVVFGYEC